MPVEDPTQPVERAEGIRRVRTKRANVARSSPETAALDNLFRWADPLSTRNYDFVLVPGTGKVKLIKKGAAKVKLIKKKEAKAMDKNKSTIDALIEQDNLEEEFAINADSTDFDGIAALRQIHQDMDEALIEAEVAIEDAKLFLASRNIKFPEP
jgi:hypothetical protein